MPPISPSVFYFTGAIFVVVTFIFFARGDWSGAIVPILIAALVFAVAWWQTRRVRRSNRP